jgi:Zn-dependent protease
MNARLGNSELIDLLLSFIVLTIAFSLRGGAGGISLPGADVLVISAVGVGTGFILHELAHKFMAQRYGYWAEYRANMFGLVMTVAMAAFLGIVFAAPGAVMIHKRSGSSPVYTMPQSTYTPDDDKYWEAYDNPRRGNEEGRIAAAGPTTNVLLAGLFFAALMSGLLGDGILSYAAYYAMYINLFLAAFNMIPIDPFDGAKILRGNALMWVAIGIPAFAGTLILMAGLI